MIRGHGLKLQVLQVETFEGALGLVPGVSIGAHGLSQLHGGMSRYFESFVATLRRVLVVLEMLLDELSRERSYCCARSLTWNRNQLRVCGEWLGSFRRLK